MKTTLNYNSVISFDILPAISRQNCLDGQFVSLNMMLYGKYQKFYK